MKKDYELRLRLKLEESTTEAILLDYLQNKEQVPSRCREMVMKALRTLWLPLAYKRTGRDTEKIRQALINCDYMWKMHFLDLQQELGVYLEGHPFDHRS